MIYSRLVNNIFKSYLWNKSDFFIFGDKKITTNGTCGSKIFLKLSVEISFKNFGAVISRNRAKRIRIALSFFVR